MPGFFYFEGVPFLARGRVDGVAGIVVGGRGEMGGLGGGECLVEQVSFYVRSGSHVLFSHGYGNPHVVEIFF